MRSDVNETKKSTARVSCASENDGALRITAFAAGSSSGAVAIG